MADAPRKQAEFDIDFAQELPPWDFFPVWWLAKSWHGSDEHVLRLIEKGELPVGVDLRSPGASRSMIRIPRKSVIEFLNRRKNLEGIATKARSVNYNEASKRRPKRRS
jgi:hypothetical protein